MIVGNDLCRIELREGTDGSLPSSVVQLDPIAHVLWGSPWSLVSGSRLRIRSFPMEGIYFVLVQESIVLSLLMN